MEKYIKEFIKDIETKLEENHKFTKEEIANIRIKLANFQHERLVHLLVTLFFAIFTLAFLGFSTISTIFSIPLLIMLVVLLFYVKHYYFLENAVQHIYKLYDEIIK